MPEEQLVERGAPNWINCELCKCRGTHWQARFVIAEDETAGRASPELPELVLLCADCSAVAKGAIDASEWKRRKLSPNSDAHLREWATTKRDDRAFDRGDPDISKEITQRQSRANDPLSGG